MDAPSTEMPKRKRVSTTLSGELRRVNNEVEVEYVEMSPEPVVIPHEAKVGPLTTKRTCIDNENNNRSPTNGQAPPQVATGSPALTHDTIISRPRANGTPLALASISGNFTLSLIFLLSGDVVNRRSSQGVSSSSQEFSSLSIDGSTLGSSGSLSTAHSSHAHHAIIDLSSPITEGPKQKSAHSAVPHREPANWNQLELGMTKPPTILGVLFSDIDFMRQLTLIKRVPSFEILNPVRELRDWCTWYDHVRQYIHFLSPKDANFVLLARVPPTYSQNIIQEFERAILDMPTHSLASRIGSVVYQRVRIDPVQRARYLCMGESRIGDPFDLFRRVIDLHYCNYHRPTPEAFVTNLFQAIEEYIPRQGRLKFNDQMFAEYPAVHHARFPTMYDYFGFNVFGKSSKKDAKLPSTPMEISHFADFLQATAALICDENGGPFCQVLVGSSANDSRPHVVTNAAHGLSPAPQHTAPPRSARTALVPAPNQDGRVMSNSTDLSPRCCILCNKPHYVTWDAYLAHPEIQDRIWKDLAAKNKASRQARVAVHKPHKSQLLAAEQASRLLASTTRSGHELGRGEPNQTGPSQPSQAVALQSQPRTTVNSVGKYALLDFHL